MPILVGPRARIEAVAREHGINISNRRDRGCAAQRSLGRRGRRAGPRGQGRSADERQPAHRRADGRGGQARDRACARPGASATASSWTCPGILTALIITDAAVNIAPDAQGQGRHHAERDRPRARPGRDRRARWRSCRRWRRSIPTCPRRSRRPRCARWRTAGRSPAPCSTARWRSTTRSTSRPREIKKIDSPVAGRANVLVVPDLEAGNMLAKSLSFLAGADAAGIVLGARVPIILTSRADSLMARLASCAVAALVAQRAPREHVAKVDGVTMTAILVLNAGSSSIKFLLFVERDGALDAVAARTDRGHPHRAAFRRAQPRDGTSLAEKTWGEGVDARPRGAVDASRGVPARPGGEHRARGGRAIGWCTAGWSTREPVRVDADVLAVLEKFDSACAAASAAQPGADPAPARTPARVAAGGVLRHGVPSRPIRTSRDASRFPPSCTTPACAGTAFTACRTSTSPRCCPSTTRAPRRAGRSCAISATARACARWRAAAASRARWASPRWTACRWARAAGASTPACCCT